MSKIILPYWHFLREDRCLGYDDGRLVEVGATLTVPCKPVLCAQGLHASRKVTDALINAPGPILSLVTLGGRVVHGSDKSVATERTCLWMCDATNILHEFACCCAYTALMNERENYREPDQRSWDVIAAKRKRLKDEISDGEFEAARAAAWEAVSVAIWGAARKAARKAARAADSVAIWKVTRVAVWETVWEANTAATVAARSAAWEASRVAPCEAQERQFLNLLADAGAPIEVNDSGKVRLRI